MAGSFVDLKLPPSAIIAILATVMDLAAKVRALAKGAGVTDAELDALDVRLTAAHEARQAEASAAAEAAGTPGAES